MFNSHRLHLFVEKVLFCATKMIFTSSFKFISLCCWILLISPPNVLTEPSCAYKSKGNRKFPDNFRFGVSTSAYQIEGGWNADGKGPSIWDTFTHEHPELISDRSNGDIGPDSYHQFDQDLAALKELKVQFYRFSISWPRILPNGDVTSKNQKGIDYYNMVIDKLIENKIEPLVTMFHYDLPEELSKFGGFTSTVIIPYFRYYADTLFENFGDRVKTWITFNEPFDYCNPGYGSGEYPPRVHSPGIGDYLCLDNTLRAHASAYRLFRKNHYRSIGGKVGITLSSRFFFSKDSDEYLINTGMQFSLGWLANPIFTIPGNYPPNVLYNVISNSAKEGRPWPRIKPIKGEWLERIKGAGDFLGLNYYTSRYIEETNKSIGEIPSWEHDSGFVTSIDPNWKRAKSTWLYCVPQGLEGILKYIRDNYENVEVIVTENGWSDDGAIFDHDRIDYIRSHLKAVLNAVNDGCNVTGYTVWSLIDNFEWLRGYTEKFGLYAVDMKSPNKERTPKKSAEFYRKVIENRTIPEIF